MAAQVQCACGASYSLKDEFAGQSLRCPKCGATVQAGAAGAPAPQADPIFARDKFLLRQQHFAISEKYYVHDEQGNPILFVKRPAHVFRQLLLIAAVIVVVILWWIIAIAAGAAVAGAEAGWPLLVAFVGTVPVILVIAALIAPKRHVTFYRDDSLQQSLLDVQQDARMYLVNATYTVRAADGSTLALLKKSYIRDVLRKHWQCTTPDGRELCIAQEDSILLSLLRRFLGPLFGVLRANFVILRGEQIIGEFNRKFTILDRYVLDMSRDRQRTLDRRIALALGVMLDTGERR
jgi:uncharacterized protein YxjI